ncbi:hypothetical protein H4R33_005275 [Dimargaris cristalligena]|uniref:Class I glutamine amidotransferase-like protein n=1 Tax=Dimargaris cristalligena TaxID=215637 RepID=A0A4P9ZPC8_9FUNG|nr:hypothetical protein H4R33_005275 [Dimargaris cristalligena]RKP34511.1 class I glutamine amidotransferase-like protein [Dimargaris cristalligena]|eukprot:RKP34511.1 class I glutamine amidotransferase-like protein [Dimargaris cristalligena]
MTVGSTLRIALLITDSPIAEVVKRHGDYQCMFTRCLQLAGQSLYPPVHVETEAFDVGPEGPGNYPEDPSAYHALLITGSKASSYENIPWINRLVSYVQATTTHYPQTKWLGICFGHQIIARAFGTPVKANSLGWELGNYDIRLSELGRELLGQNRSTMKLLQLHRDIVTGCPEGFSVLGSTSMCSNHGMVKGNQILTIQGHPEYTNDAIAMVAKVREEAGIIPPKVVAKCLETITDNNDSLWFSTKMVEFVLGRLPKLLNY